jgi:hypothetical protein
MLWSASEGRPETIPGSYLAHLDHTYVDGSISLVSLLNKVDYSEPLEDYELDEAIELLGKVNPGDWPDPEDIERIDPAELLRMNDSVTEDFVETPATTSEKAEKVLRHAIESVFGDLVQKVRSAKGEYPDETNQYLQQANGAFVGTFEYDGKKFDFTLEPDEAGWSLQYRLSAKSFDELPPVPPDELANEKPEEVRSRGRGWK